MADGDVPRLSKSGGSAPYGSTQSQTRHHTGEKRSLADDNDTEPEKKKTGAISLGMRPKPAGAAASGMKFNMKLGSSGGSSRATSKPAASAAPVKMSLAGSQKPKEPPVLKKKKSASVAQAFNQDDDSEEEEMPPEAKMRMRNMGRETPTAAGPNSFGKNMLGFCDRQKIIQRELEKQMEEIAATSKDDD